MTTPACPVSAYPMHVAFSTALRGRLPQQAVCRWGFFSLLS